LDSSAVLLTAAKFHAGKMKTFSVGYDGEFADDERRYARIAAAAAGADHAEIQISDRDFLEFLPRFVLYTDEPLADLAAVPLYYVSHLAAGQVKVVLSGEGSDEVLGGYDLGTAARRWALIRSLRRLPGHGFVAAGLKAFGDTWGELGHELEAREDLWWERRPPTMTNLLSTAEKRAILRPEFDQCLPDSLDSIRADYRSAPSASRLGQLLHVYRQSWMVEDLLMKADRMTMANSIELRVPFLDFRLVEWAARAPAHAKVRRVGPGKWETKWVLREFCRDRLPPEIVSRPKRGFPVPAYERLSSSMRGWAEELLSPRDARIKRWLSDDAVRHLLFKGGAVGSSSHDRHVLWSLLILEIWAQAWNPQ
jgi:asparagine synthase (glutamine-hydrolysing)